MSVIRLLIFLVLGFVFIADLFRHNRPSAVITSENSDGGLSRFGFLSALSLEEFNCSEDDLDSLYRP